jgi:hypothetical protein
VDPTLYGVVEHEADRTGDPRPAGRCLWSAAGEEHGCQGRSSWAEGPLRLRTYDERWFVTRLTTFVAGQTSSMPGPAGDGAAASPPELAATNGDCTDSRRPRGPHQQRHGAPLRHIGAGRCPAGRRNRRPAQAISARWHRTSRRASMMRRFSCWLRAATRMNRWPSSRPRLSAQSRT